MSEEIINDVVDEGLEVDNQTTDETDDTLNNDTENTKEGLDSDGETKEDTEIYGSPESYDYSEVQLPEGMTLDQDMVDKFNPIAKKYNLSQKSANELMNLAVELVGKNTPNAEKLSNEIQIAERNQYAKLLNNDKELSAMTDEQYGEYINTARLGVNSVATAGFKEILKNKGLSNHPEFIRTFHEIGKLCQSDTVPNGKNPVMKQQSAADILYGSK